MGGPPWPPLIPQRALVSEGQPRKRLEVPGLANNCLILQEPEKRLHPTTVMAGKKYRVWVQRGWSFTTFVGTIR